MSETPRLAVEVHPRRAWAITAFALGASLGLAWALAENRTAPMPLGQRVALRGWPITFRLPSGWKYEQQDADAWSGEIEARPATDSGMVRMIIRHDRRYPSARPDEIIHGYMSQRYADTPGAFSSHELLSLGPVAGFCVSGDRLTAHMVYPVSIAAAGIPNGPAIVVEIFARSSESGPMRRTLRSVCESIEFVSPRLSRSLGELSGKAGFECVVPTGLWCVDGISDDHAGIGFVADSGNIAPWSARAWRSFLAPPRTLADLVRDQAASNRMAIDVPREFGVTTLGTHSAANVVHAEFGRCTSVWAVDLGHGAVLMVRGTGPEALATDIDEACRKMAESAQRRTSADEFDVAAAQKAGEEAVAAVRRRGLRKPWGEGAKSIWYLYERCGEPTGYYHVQRERESSSRESGPARYGYSGTDEFQIRYPGFSTQSVRTVWTVDDDAAEFSLEQTLSLESASDDEVLKSRYARASAEAALDVTASLGKRKRSAKIEVGKAFAADPVEDLVLREVGERGAGHDAIIRMVGSVPFSAANYRCTVGRGPGSELRIAIQSDYNFDRSAFEFDDDGEVARHAFGDSVLLRRVKQSEVARSLEWFGKPEARREVEPPSTLESDE